MQDTKKKFYPFQDEFNLPEMVDLLLSSKKLIIVTSLSFMVLAFIYDFQKTPVYLSTGVIEIGKYYSLNKDDDKRKQLGVFGNSDQILIQPSNSLIKELKVVFIHKPRVLAQENLSSSSSTTGLPIEENELEKSRNGYWERKGNLVFESIEDKLIKISLKSRSIESGQKKLNTILSYIINSHKNFVDGNTQFKLNQVTSELQKINDKTQFSIEGLNQEIDFKVSALTNKISLEINQLNSLLPVLDKKILSLKKIRDDDEYNLKLLKDEPLLLMQRTAQNPSLQAVISNYKDKILDFELQRSAAITELKTLTKSLAELRNIENHNLSSNDIALNDQMIFYLLQKKDALEFELEQTKKNKQKEVTNINLAELTINKDLEQDLNSAIVSSDTQLVGKILTKKIDNKVTLIPFGFFLGLLLSVSIVLLLNALKPSTKGNI